MQAQALASMFCKTGSALEQFQSTNQTAVAVSIILYLAGYFVSTTKSNFIPRQVIDFLGMTVDAERAMPFVHSRKVDKLMSLIEKALEEEHTSVTLLE